MPKTACAQCPWRANNQGKPHRRGFYTKANLRRLWDGLRTGQDPQSCHLTDPSHPDHLEAGAPENATPQECPGSVIIVMRELTELAGGVGGEITRERISAHFHDRPQSGFSVQGLNFWLVARMQLAGQPLIGGPPVPEVDVDDPEVLLPEWLRQG